jgi:hypothetical protein
MKKPLKTIRLKRKKAAAKKKANNIFDEYFLRKTMLTPISSFFFNKNSIDESLIEKFREDLVKEIVKILMHKKLVLTAYDKLLFSFIGTQLRLAILTAQISKSNEFFK